MANDADRLSLVAAPFRPDPPFLAPPVISSPRRLPALARYPMCPSARAPPHPLEQVVPNLGDRLAGGHAQQRHVVLADGSREEGASTSTARFGFSARLRGRRARARCWPDASASTRSFLNRGRLVVRRQHQHVGRHLALEHGQRVEPLLHRVGVGLDRVTETLGRDARRDLVAGDQHAEFGAVQAGVLEGGRCRRSRAGGARR